MSEPTAEEREERLGALRKRMGRALRKGEMAEYEELKAEYDAAKDAHVMASHSEMKVAMRARRVRERAQEASVAPSGRWRLPRGFASPLAAERARSGVRPREEPRGPEGGLSPWRTGRWRPAQEQIWRP